MPEAAQSPFPPQVTATSAAAVLGHVRSTPTAGVLRPSLRQGRRGRPAPATVPAGVVRGLRDRLPGREAERFGMGPAVVPGQDLTEVAGAVRDGAVADLAAGDRKMGNGHRETAAM